MRLARAFNRLGVQSPGSGHDSGQPVVAFVARVLEKCAVGSAKWNSNRQWAGVIVRIFDRKVIHDRVLIDTRKPLDKLGISGGA